MDRDQVDATCAAFPGAEWSDASDGSLNAWKVGGKMFACIGTASDGVSVKTPDVETASLLIETGHATRAPYFHRSWVRLPWDHVEADEFRDRLRVSYEIVRASLPKKVQKALTDPQE